MAFRTHQRESFLLNGVEKPGDLLLFRIEPDAIGGEILRFGVLPRDADNRSGDKFIILQLEIIVCSSDNNAFLRIHVNMLAVVCHAEKQFEFRLRHGEHQRVFHRASGEPA